MTKSDTTQKICGWAGSEAIYIDYHNQEWGVPLFDDQKLFEFLILEGAQAGLSWITILKRREGYRDAFENFEVERVSRFTPRQLELLTKHPGIIKNRLKIKSAVTNAQVFMKIQDEFGSFAKYQWQFVNHRPIQNKRRRLSEVPAQTKISQALSKDLQKRGMTFVGPTIMYAHMQAVGMVNDHLISCFRHKECIALGEAFVNMGHSH